LLAPDTRFASALKDYPHLSHCNSLLFNRQPRFVLSRGGHPQHRIRRAERAKYTLCHAFGFLGRTIQANARVIFLSIVKPDMYMWAQAVTRIVPRFSQRVLLSPKHSGQTPAEQNLRDPV
jgi:hypothetical protein